MKIFLYLLFLTGSILLPWSSTADDEKFMLTFRHPAVDDCYVSAIYSDDVVYLPLCEVFSLLYIYYEQDENENTLHGEFPEACRWEINVEEGTVRYGRESFALSGDDFRTGNMDLYLAPAVYARIFGLIFQVNLSTLQLTLQCDCLLPVEERLMRRKRRRRLELRRAGSAAYPMLYPRDRRLIGAGITDYFLGTTLSSATCNVEYALTGSMELLGGDIKGTVRGFHHRAGDRLVANNLQWRWTLPQNSVLTSIRAGHIGTTGLQGKQIFGCAVTNEPVMPRRTGNMHVVDGHTVPGSEVELFINNQLADYTRTDESGYYRFEFPLSYGTMRISRRIHTPDGRVLKRERQVQTPYSFLPKGEVTYHLQGGFKTGADAVNQKQVVHGDVAWGIVNGLTAKMGADYLGPHSLPLYYGSISSRLFQQYLVSVDVAPGTYYRVTGGVVYPDSKSIHFSYAESSGTGWYNYLSAGSGMTAGIYLPLKIAGLNHGLRLWGTRRTCENSRSTANYRVDFNTRLGRMNLRLNYHEFIYSRDYGMNVARKSMATAAMTCHVPRNRNLPLFMKGMFVRLHNQYDIRRNSLFFSGLQVSRNLGNYCRCQLDARYDFVTSSPGLRGTITIDLPAFRSATRFILSDNQHHFSQNVSGSLAFDADRGYVTAQNRSLAGQCAASIRFFIDENNNGLFNPGEKIIPARALRINGGVSMRLGKDSVLRITRLHNYWVYQAGVDQTALPDPALAPKKNTFSFQADPNRYKPIDIPLYRTGVIEGRVFIKHEKGQTAGQGGVRLLLKGPVPDSERVLRSFTDGGFYAMNLLPGKYSLEVDGVQLHFLKAKSKPQRLEFEIEPLSDGDYVEGLEIILEVSPE